jgi:hypothetical protein
MSEARYLIIEIMSEVVILFMTHSERQCAEFMTQTFSILRRYKKNYISNYTCINRTIYSFIFISVFIIYVEEKVRKYASKDFVQFV